MPGENPRPRASEITTYFSFSFSSRWHHSARKGPYALRPVSQQSPRGCPRNSAHICLVEHRSFSAFEGGMSAASFLHSSFLQAVNAVMLWLVRAEKVPQASEHLCPAKLQTRCDICWNHHILKPTTQAPTETRTRALALAAGACKESRHAHHHVTCCPSKYFMLMFAIHSFRDKTTAYRQTRTEASRQPRACVNIFIQCILTTCQTAPTLHQHIFIHCILATCQTAPTLHQHIFMHCILTTCQTAPTLHQHIFIHCINVRQTRACVITFL